jgi:hypothetical protein
MVSVWVLANFLLLLTFAAAAPTTSNSTAALEAQLKVLHDKHAASKVLSTTAAVVTTHNDLNDGQCKDIIVIFGRGTTEPGIPFQFLRPDLFLTLRRQRG